MKSLPLPRVVRRFAQEHGGLRRGTTTAVKWALRELAHGGPRRLGMRVVSYVRRARSAADEPDLLELRTATMSREQVAASLAGLKRVPTIAFLLPIFRDSRTAIERTAADVLGQYAGNVELILLAPDTADVPASARGDRRVRTLVIGDGEPLADALNRGLAAATAEFVCMPPPGAALPPDATGRVAIAAAERPDAVWFYSDEVVIDDSGRGDGRFKPAFSPEFLLASPFTGAISVYSTTAVRAAGGFRAGFDGAKEHDLTLRLAEAVPCAAIMHLPHVLCRRPQAKDRARIAEAGRRAVAEALHRRGLVGRPEPLPLDPPAYRLNLKPKATPPVSILIPTRNAFADVKTCVDSVRAKTAHPDYEIVVIDNRSDDPALLDYLAAEERRTAGRRSGRLRVVRYDRPFDHSEMNNVAAASCRADFFVFLNNDVEILSDGWLESLLATAELAGDVAAVGAKLLYPDGTVQHGGIVFRADGRPTHAYRFRPANDPGDLGRAAVIGEFPGCTAAMLLVRRTAFDAIGGFDAAAFPTSYNDVDLCLRLRRAGGRCLMNPEVVAYHFETKTRRYDLASEDVYLAELLRRAGERPADRPRAAA